MKKKVLLLISFILVILITLNSCKESNEPKDEPPSIPPSSASFVIGFDDFNQVALAKTALPAEKTNWLRAVSILAPWKYIVKVTMAVPVASFVAAMHQKPQQQEDGNWLWAYSFGQKFSAELCAEITDDMINWDMYISIQDLYSDFHWFSGQSQLDGSAGRWILNSDPNNTQAFLQIDWTFNKTDSTGSIRYTALNAGDNSGSYIEYRRTNDTPYNRYFTLLDLPENYQIDIQWDYTTKAGRIADSLFYEDSNWHCWDASREDIVCTGIGK